MGRVWKARDEVLHRDVAIKELVPPSGLTEHERQEMRERSLREARAIARLDHNNVVRVFDVLRVDVDPWIVMEFVPSRSLSQVLSSEGPMPPARAAEIGLDVLAALRAAHRAGVLHRDVKPANVLLGENGRVVLTDFGLATAPGDSAMTQTGVVLGTPSYLAPERVTEGAVGPEADLWSLGAMLFTAVEGRSPYGRSSPVATLAALATEPPPTPAHAGPLTPLLDGLLRRDPTERINADVADDLLRVAAGRQPSPDVVPLNGPVAPPTAPAFVPPPVPVPPPAPATHAAVDTASPAGAAGQATSGGGPAATENDRKGRRPIGPRRGRLFGALAGLALAALVVSVPLISGKRVGYIGGHARAEATTTLHASPGLVPQASPVASNPQPPSPRATPTPRANQTRQAVTTQGPKHGRGATAVPPTQPTRVEVLPVNAIVWYGATKCINAPSGPTNGVPAQIWDCNGSPGQKWSFPADGTVRALGECLTVAGGTTGNGTPVGLASCTGSPWQRFLLKDTHDLVSLLADKCVDVTNGGTANGTSLQLWDCNGGVNQKWHLG
jgi:hypothetical protein